MRTTSLTMSRCLFKVFISFHAVVKRGCHLPSSSWTQLTLNMDWGYSDTDTSSTNNPSSRDECLTETASLSSEMSASDSDPPKTNSSTSLSEQVVINSKIKSRILPKSLLDSVTEKIRDGVVPPINGIKSLGNFSDDSCKGQDVKYRLIETASLLTDESVSFDICPKTIIDETPVDNTTETTTLTSSNCNDEVTNVEENGTRNCNSSDENSILTVCSDDETRVKKQTTNSFRPVPNYFISIQFSDREISTNLKDVQKSIMKKNGNYSLAVVPLHSLHMTLAVMHLGGESDIDQAKDALDRSGAKLVPKYKDVVLKLPLQGLGNFRNSVVFAKVQPGDHIVKLEEIVEEIQAQFFDKGLVKEESNFKPHVTVMKLSRVGKKLTKKTGLKKIYPDVYDEYIDAYFGCQPVMSIQLCSMLKPKGISGYYHVEHEIKFGTGSSGIETEKNSLVTESVNENTLFPTPVPGHSEPVKLNPDTTHDIINTDEGNCSPLVKSEPFHSVFESPSSTDSKSAFSTEISVAEPVTSCVSETESPSKSFVHVIEEGLEVAEEAIDYVSKNPSLTCASLNVDYLPNSDPHEKCIEISGNEDCSPIIKRLKKTPNCSIM
ncbi:uncharacterized protein LOC115211903 [Argonauta hians]